MKLLAVRMARSIWLIPRYFLNPKGVDIRPAFDGLKTRYNFLKTPFDSPASAMQGGELKFEHGVFSGKNGPVQILTLTLFADGLVVDTRSSTEDGDAFLEDATSWISKEFGLPLYTELPIKRIYASEINLIFEKIPKILDPQLAPFLKEASEVIGDKKIGKTEFIGLQIGTDPALSETPKMFRFEREINTPFEQNRYYSSAPIKTEAHLKLLEKLDEVT